MRIYLDDTAYNALLFWLLEKNKFEVVSAFNIGMINKDEEEHLKCATFIHNSILLTRNIAFAIRRFNFTHKGVLIIYDFYDPVKSVNNDKILKALKNLRKQVEENGITIENKVFPLNFFIP